MVTMITITDMVAREKEVMEKEKVVATILTFLTEEREKGKEKVVVTVMTITTKEREKERAKGRERAKERERAKVKDLLILPYLLVPIYQRLHQQYKQTFPRPLLWTQFDQLVPTDHLVPLIQIPVSSLAQLSGLGLPDVCPPVLLTEARDLRYA